MSRLQAFGWTRLAALAAIVAVALFRVTPHLDNFAPVGAMFVLGGLYLGKDWRWAAAPFVGLLLSDLVLNAAWDSRPIHPERIVDYAAFAAITLGARWAAGRAAGWRVGAIVAAPVAFFLLSNLGVWATAGMFPNTIPYPHTLQGLGECYTAALPFFRGTLVGDWLFAGLGMLALDALRARETRTAVAAFA